MHVTSTALALGLGLLTAPVTAQTPDRFSPEQLRSDFDHLYTTLQSAQPGLYSATPQSVLDQRHAEMMGDITGPMSAFEATVYFQTFLSEIRIAHTRIDFPVGDWFAWRDNGGGAVPFDIRIRDGRVLVESAMPLENGLQRGDEIIAINGTPNAIWLNRMTRHLSADTPDFAYTLLESYFPAVVWLEHSEADSLAVTVIRGDAPEITINVPLLSRDEMAALADAPVQSFQLPLFDTRMIGEDIGYLRPGPFYNTDDGGNTWDPTSYVARVDAAFGDFIEADAGAVILDLRDNPGGNNTFSDPIIAWFADQDWRFASEFRLLVSEATTASNAARLADGGGEVSAQYAELFANARNGDIILYDFPEAKPREGERFEGEVYVLINRYSYSNAVTTAALIQDYGFGTIVGEVTADMSTTYGAMEYFSLPTTGIRVGYPKAHIIRPNGDDHPHPVTPDLELDLPPLRGEHDAALEQLVDHIRAG
ncbi:S41 family peptidase [Maricaulis sp.]|uniref:S41 family peptidase n=1 Tax=Maricaulis sp. TaxID=1486257 RepID=UPI00263271D7|nr:S41 family peptidase [Maricaulis sp.]